MRFLRSLRPTVWSSNVIALLALVIAMGGGYAIARTGDAPAPATAYTQTVDRQTVTHPTSTLVFELPVPAAGSYLAIGKVDIVSPKPRTFVCRLGAIGEGDSSTVAATAAGYAEATLVATGKPAAPNSGNTQALTIVCQASQPGTYYVSGKLVATSLAGTASVKP